MAEPEKNPRIAMNVCNKLLPLKEQHAIVHAAKWAALGQHHTAELYRREAGY